jgi:membrane-bound ClpP family serine protease
VEAKKYELCNLIVNNRQELRQAYHLTAQSLLADPLEGREPNAVRIHVRERLTAAYARTISRVVRKAVADGANTIILQLECSGGDSQEARYLADELRKLKDDSGEYDVRTVAYIPAGQHAPDAVTFVALGCTQIVMGTGATIGDFDAVDAEHRDAVESSLLGLAKEREDDSAKVVESFFHPLRVYKVKRIKGDDEEGVMTGKEVEADKQKKEWSISKTITTGGGPLTAQEAKEGELAQAIIDNEDELKGLYGLKQIRDVDPDFLYYFAAFLAHPVVGIFLIMIGIVGLILELKMPGLGVPGVIAALCFVLYFWAHSQMAGHITMLAVLLFLLGLILIALEIFVVPGFGVTGISGIVLVVVSLGLATLERKPETTQEWMNFGQTLGGIGISLLGAVAFALLIVWYLPSIPYANRLVLKAPASAADTSEGQDLANEEEAALYPAAASLLGAIGVAATPLRPAGIARFGDDFIDVVSEGNYIPDGGRVQVIEIEGNRVVVKEV